MAQIYHIPAQFLKGMKPPVLTTRKPDLQCLADIDVLAELIEVHGAVRVHAWLRRLAAERGETLPLDKQAS